MLCEFIGQDYDIEKLWFVNGAIRTNLDEPVRSAKSSDAEF